MAPDWSHKSPSWFKCLYICLWRRRKVLSWRRFLWVALGLHMSCDARVSLECKGWSSDGAAAACQHASMKILWHTKPNREIMFTADFTVEEATLHLLLNWLTSSLWAPFHQELPVGPSYCPEPKPETMQTVVNAPFLQTARCSCMFNEDRGLCQVMFLQVSPAAAVCPADCGVRSWRLRSFLGLLHQPCN